MTATGQSRGAGPPGPGIERLLALVGKLRGKDGCPWDREQTVTSLKPCLVEETYEVIEAIEEDNPERHLEELGDLLLQIVLHSQIRAEDGNFTFDDVAHRISDKLVRRHPHVFGGAEAANSEEVLKNWETIKKEEGGPGRALLNGIPRHLPALQKAQRVQGRVARVGFDWPDLAGVLSKIDEELAELREAVSAGDPDKINEEIGDLLFSVVNLARHRDVSAEDALRYTISKFVCRFSRMEQALEQRGRLLKDCSIEEMDAEWDAAKQDEELAT